MDDEIERFPIPVDEFAQVHRPGRAIELMGGFLAFARTQDWEPFALYDEWVRRYEEFRSRPAGG